MPNAAPHDAGEVSLSITPRRSEQDLDGESRRAAGAQDADGLVEVDIPVGCEVDRLLVLVSGRNQLLEPPDEHAHLFLP